MTPNIEERLTAAAFTILTDGNRHSHEALRWAARFMRKASHGRPTEFQSRLANKLRGKRVRAWS